MRRFLPTFLLALLAASPLALTGCSDLIAKLKASATADGEDAAVAETQVEAPSDPAETPPEEPTEKAGDTIADPLPTTTATTPLAADAGAKAADAGAKNADAGADAGAMAAATDAGATAAATDAGATAAATDAGAAPSDAGAIVPIDAGGPTDAGLPRPIPNFPKIFLDGGVRRFDAGIFRPR